MLNQNQETIIEHTGAESWDVVVALFSGKTKEEIEAELDQIFTSDDNAKLAQLISDELD